MNEKFWQYVAEREHIRLRREAGEPWPWTADKILQTYKFTNVRRVNDRTTKTFAAIYEEHKIAAARVALYNCGLFRYFGTEYWAQSIGWMLEHNTDLICALASDLIERGRSIFTGAYVITNSGRKEPKYQVVADYLGKLWAHAPAIVKALEDTGRWEAAYNILRNVEGFGGSGFMAKEVLQDYLIWLPYEPLDAATFTPVGPGARRGLNRLHGRPLVFTQPEKQFMGEVGHLRYLTQPFWKAEFPDGGQLSAHDIQFCLCEFDKYERVRLGEGRPRSTYKRGMR